MTREIPVKETNDLEFDTWQGKTRWNAVGSSLQCNANNSLCCIAQEEGGYRLQRFDLSGSLTRELLSRNPLPNELNVIGSHRNIGAVMEIPQLAVLGGLGVRLALIYWAAGGSGGENHPKK